MYLVPSEYIQYRNFSPIFETLRRFSLHKSLNLLTTPYYMLLWYTTQSRIAYTFWFITFCINIAWNFSCILCYRLGHSLYYCPLPFGKSVTILYSSFKMVILNMKFLLNCLIPPVFATSWCLTNIFFCVHRICIGRFGFNIANWSS